MHVETHLISHTFFANMHVYVAMRLSAGVYEPYGTDHAYCFVGQIKYEVNMSQKRWVTIM